MLETFDMNIPCFPICIAKRSDTEFLFAEHTIYWFTLWERSKTNLALHPSDISSAF